MFRKLVQFLTRSQPVTLTLTMRPLMDTLKLDKLELDRLDKRTNKPTGAFLELLSELKISRHVKICWLRMDL